MFLLPGTLAVLVGILRGGRLTNLSQLPLAAVPRFYFAFSLQIASHFVPPSGQPFFVIGSFALLMAALFTNRRLPGMPLVLLGTLLNSLVIILNGGQMPVALDSGVAQLLEMGPKHTVLTANTRLPWLADVIPMTISLSRAQRLFSIGDLFQMAGLFWVIVAAMGTGKRHKKVLNNTY